MIEFEEGQLYVQLKSIHRNHDIKHKNVYRRFNLEYRSRCYRCFFTSKRPNKRWSHSYIPVLLKPGYKMPRLFFRCKICLQEELVVETTPNMILSLIDEYFSADRMKEEMVKIYGNEIFS